MACTDAATRRGSSVSSSAGLPVSIWQKSHRRVHWLPPIRNVASRSSQHSKILGQPASSHTVCSPSRRTRDRNSLYSGPIVARVLIHEGFFSIGTCELRASTRSILRPSGATVTRSLPSRRWDGLPSFLTLRTAVLNCWSLRALVPHGDETHDTSHGHSVGQQRSQRVLQVLLEHLGTLHHAHVPADLGTDRGHSGIADATGHDPGE